MHDLSLDANAPLAKHLPAMPEPNQSRNGGSFSHEPKAATGLSVESVRDRVVRAALSCALVTGRQVDEAWAAFKRVPRPQRGRFWRFVADRSGADREAFYALAARTYGFVEVDLSVSDLTVFLKEVRPTFNRRQWRTMAALRILPIGHGAEPDEGQGPHRMVFASSDPTRIEVNNFLSSLPAVKSFVLHYGAGPAIDYVLDRVLPVIFAATDGEEIFEGGARLVPLDPLRERVVDRGSYRKAA